MAFVASDLEKFARIWIPVGAPGFSGHDKQRRADVLDDRFGIDGWRYGFVVRGEFVDFASAIAEYEESYRVHLGRNPAMVEWLVERCGNVYDHSVSNVFDDDYEQPGPAANHYQDISVRRVVAELHPEPVSSGELCEMTDMTSGGRHRVPRATGFRGDLLAQIRDPLSSAFFLNPALVPVHDPTLITTMPNRREWYHEEGCAHLSVEAFWQMSKVIEVRYDRFVASRAHRMAPLAGL